MEKLGNPFLTDGGLYITQGNHSTVVVEGIPTNKTAFDFAGDKPLYALWDCSVTKVVVQKPIYETYFLIDQPDGSKICVYHAKPNRTGNFKKGELIVTTPIQHPKGKHYHMMILVNNYWEVLMDYIDRSTKIGGVGRFGYWPTYQDKYLNLGLNLVMQVTPLIGINIRQQPTSKSARVGGLIYNTKIIVKDSVQGEKVDGDTTWWRYGSGFVSNRYLKHV